MQIDVFSDPVCPWCFIGHRRMKRALDTRPDVTPIIRWRPFQLNPQMPAEGMPRRRYLALKFGGEAQADRIYKAIDEAGQSEGIDFKFDAIATTPNTLQAHRLIRLAEGEGMADGLVNALFEAYFLNGQDIGDADVLRALGVAAGLEGDIVRQFLQGEEFAEDIRSEDAFARRLGIDGVPCFILNGRYALSGAQEPAAFYPLFDMAAQEDALAPAGD